MDKKNITIMLAPMRGLTGKVFRQAITQYFFGIDTCMTPFFSVTESSIPDFSRYSYHFSKDEIKGNAKYNIIPQLIGKDANAIARIVQMFVDNGFSKINLNLGCPMPQITKRKRGSGLLPFPEDIDKILNKVLSNTQAELSVKIRLGKKDYNEIFPVIEVLNNYPLDFVAIHPRLAIDKYEGALNLNIADKAIALIKHQKIFNGDIVDTQSFEAIKKRYPNISDFMIGRGLLSNPWLSEEIKGLCSCNRNTNASVFNHLPPWFFKFNTYYNYLLNELNSISHLKAYWTFFIKLFKNDKELYNKMVRAQTKEEMKLDFMIC